MRLYRAELYKLYHKKAFLIGSVLTVTVMLVYFWLLVADQVSSVNGATYYGYDAVKVDRQITEAYKGEVTDEKVQQIVEEYGLSLGVEDGYRFWRDANYLNGLVATYFSDGYIRNWEDYQIPMNVYAIADTEWGELQKIMGKAIPLAYTKGWQVFFDTLQIGMMSASILIIIGTSVVFAQESQTGMLPLLFTAQEGKEKDAKAKIAAAFTLTIVVYSVVVLSSIALCGSVFGLDGGDCPLNIAMDDAVWIDNPYANMPVQFFAWIVIGYNLLAVTLLFAITLYVSAYCKSTFGAVTISAILWGMPMLIAMMFRGLLYLISTCMPIFLVMTIDVYETISRDRTIPTVLFAVALSLICVEEGCRVYRRQS